MQRIRIEFPQEKPSYYPVQTAIKFLAVADGRRVLCFIEVAALAENFDDFREGEGMETFFYHQSEIQSIAAVMIENGFVNADGDLFIHNREFALFKEKATRSGGWGYPLSTV